jgi:hypothetical protein
VGSAPLLPVVGLRIAGSVIASCGFDPFRSWELPTADTHTNPTPEGGAFPVVKSQIGTTKKKKKNRKEKEKDAHLNDRINAISLIDAGADAATLGGIAGGRNPSQFFVLFYSIQHRVS